jgi:hypothetical protein
MMHERLDVLAGHAPLASQDSRNRGFGNSGIKGYTRSLVSPRGTVTKQRRSGRLSPSRCSALVAACMVGFVAFYRTALASDRSGLGTFMDARPTGPREAWASYLIVASACTLRNGPRRAKLRGWESRSRRMKTPRSSLGLTRCAWDTWGFLLIKLALAPIPPC